MTSTPLPKNPRQASVEFPVAQTWETDRRYFRMYCSKDLFGDLVLTRAWGSKNSRRRGGRTDLLASEEDAARLIKTVAQRRKAHGYQLVG